MRQLAAVVAATAVLALVVVGTTSAASTFLARLGTQNGAARLTQGGPDAVYINARRLARGTWTVTLSLGTCARPTTRIRTLPPLAVGASGHVARTTTITRSQANLARRGVLRLVRGSTVVCGSFAPEVGATTRPTSSSSPSRSPSPSPTASPTGTPNPSASVRPTASTPANGTPSPTSTGNGSGASLPIETGGSGNAETVIFSATAAWKVGYGFDCEDHGGPGQFRLEVIQNGQIVQSLASLTRATGQGVVEVSGRAGATRLRITSDCDWAVSIAAA
jgi:hypothetical protein